MIVKGNIIHTPTINKFEIIENGFIIVNEDGRVEMVVKELPGEYHNQPIYNFGDKLIIPGLVDLHIHSGQYPNRGLCLDESLMDWLYKCTYPIEAKFKDIEFAKSTYAKFIKALWRGGNLRSVIYDTINVESAKLLVDMFILSGMGACIGKANMDINVPDYVKEDTKQSLKETESFIISTKGKSKHIIPAVYPRFIPVCSDELLKGLGEIAIKYNVPVISHLSESKEEVRIVEERFPQFPNYASVYKNFGLLGQTPTVMAHAVHSKKEEIKLLDNNNIWVAHSPNSNMNLASGLMPVRISINNGIKVGLGSDIGASADISILRSMYTAIAVSKIIWLYSNERLMPLKTYEAFYMGTKAGGSFFGKVGSFEKDYEFDALVIDDSELCDMDYTLEERIERLIYLGKEEYIATRFMSGNIIPEPNFG